MKASVKTILAALAMTPVIAFSAENPFLPPDSLGNSAQLERRIHDLEMRSQFAEDRLNEALNQQLPGISPKDLNINGISSDLPEGQVLEVFGELHGNCLYRKKDKTIDRISPEKAGFSCADLRAKYLEKNDDIENEASSIPNGESEKEGVFSDAGLTISVKK